MLQATARQLQQSVCEYEARLEEAYTRMQSGEAPTDDIDEEWRRMLRLHETRQRDDEMRRQVSGAVTHTAHTYVCGAWSAMRVAVRSRCGGMAM